jgi:hypothetical protein
MNNNQQDYQAQVYEQWRMEDVAEIEMYLKEIEYYQKRNSKDVFNTSDTSTVSRNKIIETYKQMVNKLVNEYRQRFNSLPDSEILARYTKGARGKRQGTRATNSLFTKPEQKNLGAES